MRICIVYICAYIVLVCIGIYIHTHVHFCAVATVRRGALLFLATFATFTACFLIKTFIHAFLPYLLPFPFCLSCDPCIHAYLLPYLLPYVCQNGSKVHCIRFVGLFKRFNCVDHTFTPFAPFRALK